MKDCPNCHSPNPDDAAVCRVCQSPFQSPLEHEDTRMDTDAPETLSAGDMIDGRYQVISELGVGGMGVVYRVRDTKLRDREVALKMIRPELVAHPEARRRFKDEVITCLELDHPNIVRVYDLKEWEGRSYFTMEYIRGRSLRQMLDERRDTVPPFDAAGAVSIAGRVLDALAYAHRKTVHRDIKPENIMVRGEFPEIRVKVLDFGIARAMSPSRFSRTAHALGTAYYMAPEQMAGKGEIDHRADLYAVGMVLYELLTGRMAVGFFRFPSEIVDNLSPAFDDVLKKALAPEPDERFADAGSMQSALGEALSRQAEMKKAGAKERELKRAKERERRVAGKAGKRSDAQPSRKGKAGGGGRGRSVPRVRAVALLLLLVAVAAVAGWSVYVRQFAGPALRVITEPAGAVVYIDGGRVGPSPVEVKHLDPGPHRVRAVRSRYRDYEERVFIQKGETRQVRAVLAPLPMGDLKIDSTPGGARIVVDGKPRGRTPTLVKDLPKGLRKVALTREGFDPWREEVEIVPLKTAKVHARLVSVYGSLEVRSTPSGADVFIGKEKVGRTPLTLDRVRKGSRTVRVVKAGYDDWEQTVRIRAGAAVSVRADLVTLYGGLRVTSNPAGAWVYIDGQRTGKTPFASDRVRKGKRVVRVVKAGYEPWEGSVRVRAAETARVEAALAAGTGNLKVVTRPAGAAVWINGKAAGRSPLTRESVRSGPVRVEARKDCYEPEERRVEVPGGRTVEVRLDLKPACGSLKVVSQPPGAAWYLDGEMVGRTPGVREGIAKGSHQVSVKMSGYKRWSKAVEVPAGERRAVTVRLRVSLRTEPTTLSADEIRAMLRRYNFYDSSWNENGDFRNDFTDNGDGTVTDRATGLMWQKGGSSKYMDLDEARKYIADLNRRRFAGHADWRLPTLAELCSLVENKKKNGNLYIDPVFDPEQWWCWSADRRSSGSAWSVGFDGGNVYWSILYFDYYVRAVRSWQ